MYFKKYYIENENGKSNCIIRSFCKLYNKEYQDVLNSLYTLQKQLNCENFNDILVFEEYMKNNNTLKIECKKNIKVKDLKLEDGNYIVFCWDKNEYYHMVPIIKNVLYDKTDESLQLYVISIYKQKL